MSDLILDLEAMARHHAAQKKLFTSERSAMKKTQAIGLARVKHWAEVEAGLAAEKQAAALLHQVAPVKQPEISKDAAQVPA